MASTGSGPFAHVSGDAEPGHLDQGSRAVSLQGPGFLHVVQAYFKTGMSQAGGSGDSQEGPSVLEKPTASQEPQPAPFCPFLPVSGQNSVVSGQNSVTWSLHAGECGE